MRREMKPNLPPGHLHIFKFQNVNQYLDLLEIEKLLKTVSEGIEEGIKGI